MKSEDSDMLLDQIKYRRIVNELKFEDTSQYLVLSEGTDFLKIKQVKELLLQNYNYHCIGHSDSYIPIGIFKTRKEAEDYIFILKYERANKMEGDLVNYILENNTDSDI